jgi:hypothetical protein
MRQRPDRRVAPAPPLVAPLAAVNGHVERPAGDHIAAAFAMVEATYHYMLQFVMAEQDARESLEHSTTAGAPPRSPAEKFAFAWLAGEIPLPLAPCTAQQLYRGFLWYWPAHGGGRAPPSQNAFTRAVQRWVNASDSRALEYKVVNLASERRHAQRQPLLVAGAH